MTPFGHDMVKVMSDRGSLVEPLSECVVLCESFWEPGIGGDDKKSAGFEEGERLLDCSERGMGSRDGFWAAGQVAQIEYCGIKPGLKRGGENVWEVPVVGLGAGPAGRANACFGDAVGGGLDRF